MTDLINFASPLGALGNSREDHHVGWDDEQGSAVRTTGAIVA